MGIDPSKQSVNKRRESGREREEETKCLGAESVSGKMNQRKKKRKREEKKKKMRHWKS